MPFLGTTGGGSVKQYGGQANLGYFIKNSVRLRSSASAYLNRTLTTPTSANTWTLSVWLKRGILGSSYQSLFGTIPSTGAVIYYGADSIVFWKAGAAVATSTSVYRDPSAWYHLVISSNGTTVTAYINNVSVLSYTGTLANINSANAHYIGTRGGLAEYFDGYLTEVNFIDGQALTPSSFGKTDAATNQWIPKKFAGTYGTNGFYLKFADASAATAAAIGKDSSGNGNNWTPNNIDVSTPTTIKSYTTTGTSTWIAPLGVTSVNYLVVAGGGAGGSAGPTMYDSGAGGGGAGGVANGSLTIVPGTSYTLTVGTAGAGTSGRTRGVNGSNSVFATITAIGGGGGAPGVAGNDGAAGGSGGGSSTSGAGGAGTPGQGFAGASSTTSSGGGGGGASAAATASSNNQGGNGGAGFTSSISGSPVTYGGGGGGGAYSGSPGPGGSGGSSIGGAGGTNNSNGSNATGYGSGGGGSGGTYNTTGTLSGGSGSQGIVILSYTSPTSNTYDAMIDSPTRSAVASNYATWNPLVGTAGRTYSDGNLKYSYANNWHKPTYSTIGTTTTLIYCELTNQTTNVTEFAIVDSAFTAAFNGADTTNGSTTNTLRVSNNAVTFYAAVGDTASIYKNGSTVATGLTTAGNNDIIMMAFDPTTGKIWFGVNGVWHNSGNPAAGTNASYTWTGGTGPYFVAVGEEGGGTATINFGQRPFTYTPPSGFKSLNTFNLP